MPLDSFVDMLPLRRFSVPYVDASFLIKSLQLGPPLSLGFVSAVTQDQGVLETMGTSW